MTFQDPESEFSSMSRCHGGVTHHTNTVSELMHAEDKMSSDSMLSPQH